MSTRSGLLLGFAMLVVLYVSGPGPAAATKFSEWSAPVLVPNVNSPSSEFGPALSKNRRSLYFGSDRPGGSGDIDLWVSQRASVRDAWGPPVNLGASVNTSALENVPYLSQDGHWLFFNSNRPGSIGAQDLWVSYRRDNRNDFGWGKPVNLGPQVNSAVFDGGASLFDNGDEDEDDEDGKDGKDDDDDNAPALLFFGSNRPGGPGLVDLYVSSRNDDGSFGPPQLLPELSSTFNDQRPSIRSDGLEIFQFSDRPGGAGELDLWVATRETLHQVWNSPENLGPIVNGSSNDTHPHIARDRRTLYFASNRPGGPGLSDLYVSTRNKHGKPKANR